MILLVSSLPHRNYDLGNCMPLPPKTDFMSLFIQIELYHTSLHYSKYSEWTSQRQCRLDFELNHFNASKFCKHSFPRKQHLFKNAFDCLF